MWIIEDWMSRHVYTDKELESYGHARDFISDIASNEADTSEVIGSDEWDDKYNGVCEDLYAVEVK